MIYEPAEDSFLLEKEVRKCSRGKKVLDVGCGSGILSLAAREGGAAEVLAVDINPEAVKEIKKKGIEAIESDLFSAISPEEKFDLIVFNPPYLPYDAREDRESARITSGGKRGDEIIIRFLENAGEHLSKDGLILLLVSSLTPSKRILDVLSKKKLEEKVVASQKVFMETLEVWEIKQRLKRSGREGKG